MAAAIFRGSPVCGLRPVRAARWVEVILKRPGRDISSPLATVFTMVSVNALITASTWVLPMSQLVAIALIRSALFICISCLFGCSSVSNDPAR